MKNQNIFPWLFPIFIACTKDKAIPPENQPVAAFTSNCHCWVAISGAPFISGNTIHLTNNSNYSSSYLWTMPDGTTFTTEDLDYQTDTTYPGGEEIISLVAFSKSGKLSNSTSQKICINQPINESDFFTVTQKYPTTCKPTRKGLFKEENGNWALIMSKDTIVPGQENPGYVCIIKFNLPKSLLQSGIYSINAGEVSIVISDEYHGAGYRAFSGNLNLSFNGIGKAHITFNQVIADGSDFSKFWKDTISGSISMY